MSDFRKWVLPYPVSGKFRNNPLHNLLMNVGTKTRPLYVEGVPYPPFPWALCRMKKYGDGENSRFVPEGEPDDHRRDDPLKFWKMAQENGDVPFNIPAPERGGSL